MSETLRLRELYINGAMALIVLVTYCALTTISMVNWNSEISSALVMGFALLAKDVVSKMFQLLATRTGGDDAHAVATPPKA